MTKAVIFILFIFIFSCSKNEIIHYQIRFIFQNVKSDSIEILLLKHERNFMTIPEAISKSRRVDDSTYTLDIALDSARQCYLLIKPYYKSFDLFITQSDTLYVQVNNTDFGISFAKDIETSYTYLDEFTQNEIMKNRDSIDIIDSSTILKSYLEICNNLNSIVFPFQQNIYSADIINDCFIYIKNDFLISYLKNVIQCPQNIVNLLLDSLNNNFDKISNNYSIGIKYQSKEVINIMYDYLYESKKSDRDHQITQKFNFVNKISNRIIRDLLYTSLIEEILGRYGSVYIDICKQYLNNIDSINQRYYYYTAKAIIEKVENIKIGSNAPDFSMLNYDNIPQTLSSFKGNVVLLNFWGTWCPPCLDKMNEIYDLAKQNINNNFVILNIAIENGSPDRWRNYIKNEFEVEPTNIYNLISPNGFNSEQIINYNIRLIPRMILIDKSGKIFNSDIRDLDIARKLINEKN